MLNAVKPSASRYPGKENTLLLFYLFISKNLFEQEKEKKRFVIRAASRERDKSMYNSNFDRVSTDHN